MWKTILLERPQDGVAVLTVNRPEAMNSLNSQVLSDLEAAVAAIRADASIDVVIVTGAGPKVFVAGADIAEMANMTAEQGRAFSAFGHRVMSALESLDQVVIAAVNGFALGGGNELALACDIRVAADSAQFGQPEVGLGIPAGFGGTQRLPRLIGPGRAKLLLYTADRIRADEAYRIGLVDMVVPAAELMASALGLAEKIRKQRKFAVQQTKKCIAKGLESSLDAGLSYEAQAFGLCCATTDQKEAMNGFLAKKK